MVEKRCPSHRKKGKFIKKIKKYEINQIFSYRDIKIYRCDKDHLYAQVNLYYEDILIAEDIVLNGYKIPIKVSARFNKKPFIIRLRKNIFAAAEQRLGGVRLFMKSIIVHTMLIDIDNESYYFVKGKLKVDIVTGIWGGRECLENIGVFLGRQMLLNKTFYDEGICFT